jgi:hypothetical protein
MNFRTLIQWCFTTLFLTCMGNFSYAQWFNPTPYCSPNYGSNCGFPMGISSFSLGTGGSVINFTGGTALSICGLITQNSLNITGTVAAGQTLPFNIANTYTVYMGGAIWIDLNRNNVFESSELLWFLDNASGSTVNTPSFSGNITIPANATSGLTRMRVLTCYFGSPSASGACGFYSYGDARDFTINIVPNNDAGVTSITTSTAAPFPAGANNIVAVLRNFGGNTVTSATIDWTINGISQGAVNWTGSLTSGQSTNVTLATGVNFPAVGSLSVNANVVSTNNFNPDGNPANNGPAVPTLLGAALNGTYTVGPGNPLATPMDAANQLTAGGTSGPVTLNIMDGVYTGNMYLGNIPGNQSSRPIIIQSSSGNRATCVIQFSGLTTPTLNTGALANSTSIGGTPTLRLNNANWVTFNNITFSALNPTYNVAVELCGTAPTVLSNALPYGGSNNVTFNSCSFNGQSSSTLFSMNDVLFLCGVNGSLNNNLTITNSVFNGSACQIYALRNFISAGGVFLSTGSLITSPPTPSAAWNISNNTFNNVGGFPMRISNTTDLQFNNNIISSTNPVSQRGIMFTEYEGVFSFGKNRINLPVNAGFEAIFIGTRIVNSTRALVSNNYIQASGGGFAINSSSALNVDYMHNTVINSGSGSALNVASGSGLTIVNNIFYNTGAGPAITAPVNYGTSNFNCYYTNGATLGIFNSAAQANLAGWRTASGQDAGSSSTTINFANVANGNLALTSVDPLLYGIGSQSNLTVNSNIRNRVPDDIMGTSRNRSEIYMGAFQLVPVISFNPAPPRTFEGCQNQTVVMNANATVTAGATMTFTWQRNGSPLIDGVNGVSGSRTPVLTITGAQPSLNGGDYVLNVTATGGATPIVSDIISVNINAPIEVVRQPESRMMCTGNEQSLSVIANGTITGYQWQKDGRNINGATSPVYVIQNADFNTSGRYRCVLSGTCGTTVVNTNEATIFVSDNTLVGKHPESVGVAIGTTGYLNVDVSATAQIPGYTPQFQWFKGTTALRNDARISGATTNQLTVRNIRQTDVGNDYTCVITGLCGSQTSNPGGFFVSSIQITSQPQDAEVCAGREAVMNVVANANTSGVQFTYQWMKDGRAIPNSSSVTGTTTNTLRLINPTSADAGIYTVMVTGTGGANIISNTATLTILDKPAVTTQPTNVRICEGASASMSIVATGGGLRYQWQASGVDVPGATGTTVTVPNVPANFNGAKVTCIVTNNCGNVTSSEALLTVDPKPFVVEQPTNRVVNFGGKLTLTVRADNATRYQWTLNGTDIPGATTATYEVRNAVMADEGRYTVKMTNDCGTIESQTAQVQVGPTSVEEESLKAGYSIGSATPTPTNDVATIQFTTPEAQQTRIALYDMQGRELLELFNGISLAGENSIQVAVNQLTSGTYTYTLRSGKYMVSKRMVIVR